jgi:hypothetical protein
MKVGAYAVMLMLAFSPAVVQAQSAGIAEQPAAPAAPATASMRDHLMPSTAAAAITAPAVTQQAAHETVLQPVVVSHRGGVAYMIAGAALFAGGLIAGGGAGTVLILAGAGIGAYGLYLHFS